SVTHSAVYISLSHTRPRPPISTLFPYTTLFRSFFNLHQHSINPRLTPPDGRDSWFCNPRAGWRSAISHTFLVTAFFYLSGASGRSEEHTSELQSRFDLVCRLLLEKKKSNTTSTA